jgi:gas vesicle protein
MRFDSHESENPSQVGIAVTFLLMGLGAGALLALLATSKTGRRFRKTMRRRYQDARDALHDWTQEAQEAAEEMLERGAELRDQIRDQAAPLMRGIRRP